MAIWCTESGTDTYCYRPAEVDAIVKYCGQHAGLIWLGNVVTALASTGVRISELAALRWSAVDSDFHTLQIVDERHRRRRSRGEVRTTKTGQSRAFLVHADLRRVLDTLPQSADGWIFHGPLGGRLKADVVRRALVRDILEKLRERFPTRPGEMGFIDGRLHSFRHFFCSQCAQGGVAEHVVMSWLGLRVLRWCGITSISMTKKANARCSESAFLVAAALLSPAMVLRVF
jgi:integrase